MINFKHILFSLFLLFVFNKGFPQGKPKETDGEKERQYLVKTLTRVADPVLLALSKNELKKQMPFDAAKERFEERKSVTYLEALGRLLAGMAPWLELGPDDTAEGKLRKKYIDLAVIGIRHATDPQSPDYMNFNTGGQPLVDAAFLSHALLRAPTQLWGRLDEQTKKNLIRELKSSRVITPPPSNWLLFSAMVEAALLKFDGSCDRMRIDYAIRSHQNWYKGDGAYGDGQNFHWDYYNSFVIQPMLLDVVKTVQEADRKSGETYATLVKRAQRYAAVQERMISPEGTYPPIGRSLAYRYGAFQLLSQIALMEKLPDDVSPRQVRAALYSVIRRQTEAPGTFDKNGWLRIGMYGYQPGLGEGYISTGSLYLCSVAFLVLGLPEDHAFWKGKDEPWTAKKVWLGEPVPIDHAMDDK